MCKHIYSTEHTHDDCVYFGVRVECFVIRIKYSKHTCTHTQCVWFRAKFKSYINDHVCVVCVRIIIDRHAAIATDPVWHGYVSKCVLACVFG